MLTLCSHTDRLTLKGGNSLSIKSPGYSASNDYPDNCYRLWEIKAPIGSVIKFIVRSLDIEDGGDNIYIENGTDPFTNEGNTWTKWTGLIINNLLESMDFTNSGSSVRMIFTSDFKTTKSGFWIQLQAVEGNNLDKNSYCFERMKSIDIIIFKDLVKTPLGRFRTRALDVLK